MTNKKELKDEELDKVNGGSNLTVHFFDKPEDVVFLFYYGDIVYVKENIFCRTVKCKILENKVFDDPQYHCYTDIYRVKSVEDTSDLNTWVSRDDIVNQAK